MSSLDGNDVRRLTFTGLGEADLRSDWGTGQILFDGPPRARRDCTNDGWKRFFRPVKFTSQGNCVSYFNHSR